MSDDGTPYVVRGSFNIEKLVVRERIGDGSFFF